MKSIKVLFFGFVFFMLLYPIVSAQEVELETYYGERKGFTIDLPSDWTSALDESSSLVNILMSISMEDPNTNVMMTIGFGYGLLRVL